MSRTGLFIFTFGAMMAWGQAQDTKPSSTDKIDRASAYYHYAMAHMYSEMSLASGGNHRAYLEKAEENYKEAVKDDPQTPPMVTNGFHAVKPLPPSAQIESATPAEIERPLFRFTKSFGTHAKRPN